MSHPDEGVLQELLDGELAPTDAAAVRAHLAGCVPCAVILRDLGATQAEADAIVARLPLDPPLVVPGSRATAPRRVNLRMIGLAASAVLVAGTSWILLRSSPDRAYLRGRDTASGYVLPMPSEERQEVPATTPAAPPGPALGTRADQPAKAKQAPREADAIAEPSPTQAAAPRAQAVEAEKKELADDSRRSNDAVPANAPAPAPAVRIVPPSAARLAAGASKATEATTTTSTIAGAVEQTGFPVYTIPGLAPVSVELLAEAGEPPRTVRQRYVVGGVPVVLLQENLLFNIHTLTQPAVVPADSASGRPASVSWDRGGTRLLLEGALPADSLEALMKRLR